MPNLDDQLRHSVNILLSTPELMAKVKAELAEEKMRKPKKVKPIIEWNDLLKTKLISKPCFI